VRPDIVSHTLSANAKTSLLWYTCITIAQN
jgi:hypothetical protein